MNIFITGATGFIGANLALRLAEAGHRVKALYRNPDHMQLLKHDRIVPSKGDVLDREGLKAHMRGCDAVYHLAAYTKPWDKDPEMFRRVNVGGTRNVLAAARQAGVKKVVFTSTAGVIGPSEGEQGVTEDTERITGFFNEYEATKAEAEQVIQAEVQKGLHVVIVNPTRVYGPGLLSDSNAVTRMVRLYTIGKWFWLPGSGHKIGNYVYVDDVVDGHLRAMERGEAGARYLLGGVNVTYRQFFSVLRTGTGKNYPLFRIPLFIMYTFAGIQLFLAQVFGRTPLITPKWIRKYMYDWAVDSRKAQQRLDYRITSLSAGLRKTVDWIAQDDEHAKR